MGRDTGVCNLENSGSSALPLYLHADILAFPHALRNPNPQYSVALILKIEQSISNIRDYGNRHSFRDVCTPVFMGKLLLSHIVILYTLILLFLPFTCLSISLHFHLHTYNDSSQKSPFSPYLFPEFFFLPNKTELYF